MSYSFSITADTKGGAASQVANALAEVAKAQSVHAADERIAANAAYAFIGVLKEPGDGECVVVSMSGSLGWRDPGPGSFTNASVNITAYITQKSKE